MKKSITVVTLSANHGSSEITTILNMARFFAFNIRKEVLSFGGNKSFMAKRKKHSQRSDLLTTAEYVQQAQYLINDKPASQ